MSKPCDKESLREWLELALSQAAFIHGTCNTSREIALKAICDLRITSEKQKKRRYYFSRKEEEPKDKKPKRVRLGEDSLVQHLVLFHSEYYERMQESNEPDSLTEGDMLKRYICFIYRKALKRNSLYATTGRCRFICNYKYTHVSKIYTSILAHDDPFDLSKGNEDFRRNKHTWSEMIYDRFKENLRIEETQNGQEKHFVLRKDQDNPLLKRLIDESLNICTPWSSECSLPGFMRNEYISFGQGDEHDAREIRRFHVLFHPACFTSLTTALSIDAPDTRLGIPQFVKVKPLGEATPGGRNGGPAAPVGGNGDGSYKTSPQEETMEELAKRMASQTERLERFTPSGVITVKIDGKEAARFNIEATNRVQFVLDNEEAERIEIFSQSEQLVLAVHFLYDDVWQSLKRECVYMVRHKNGAKIRFIFKLIGNVGEGKNKLSVTVAYAETKLARYLALLGRRLRLRASNWNPAGNLLPEIRKAINALALVITLSIYITVCWSVPEPKSLSRNLASEQEAGKNPAIAYHALNPFDLILDVLRRKTPSVGYPTQNPALKR